MRDNFHLALILHIRYLLAQAANQALHQPDVPENDARLHILDRVFAQSGPRRRHIHAIQARSRAAERLRRNHQARRDSSSQEISTPGNHIEGGRGTERNNDGRPTVQGVRGNGGRETVRTDLPRIIHQQLNPQVERVIQHNGFFAAVAHRQFLKNGRQRRHNTRKDNIIDIRQLVSRVTREIVQHHRVFVRCALPRGRYHPMVLHHCTVVEAKLDIGIADINGEQHCPLHIRESYTIFCTEAAYCFKKAAISKVSP